MVLWNGRPARLFSGWQAGRLLHYPTSQFGCLLIWNFLTSALRESLQIVGYIQAQMLIL